jgi:hypothetical protein
MFVIYRSITYSMKYLDIFNESDINELFGGNNSMGNVDINNLLSELYKHQICVKNCHFITNSFALHKATDAYLIIYLANFDLLLETLLGVQGKPTNVSININCVSNAESCGDELKSSINTLISMLDKMECDDKGVITIRDSMISEANKLKYLLTFN